MCVWDKKPAEGGTLERANRDGNAHIIRANRNGDFQPSSLFSSCPCWGHAASHQRVFSRSAVLTSSGSNQYGVHISWQRRRQYHLRVASARVILKRKWKTTLFSMTAVISNHPDIAATKSVHHHLSAVAFRKPRQGQKTCMERYFAFAYHPAHP